MNIEALNSALESSNLRKKDWNATKPVQRESYTSELISQYDDSYVLNESAQTSGWRSGQYSFLNNVDESAITSTRYSDLKSLDMNSDATYNTAKSNAISKLENQLVEAKNTLSKLEAEKEASKKNAKNQLIAYMMSGAKLDATVVDAINQKPKSYDSKIRQQQVEISGIEARLEKVRGEQN